MSNGAGEKPRQRKAGISARMAIPMEEARQMSRRISERLLAHKAYVDADIILSYCPFRGEADVGFFNEQAILDGKTLALPICGDGGRLIAAVPRGRDSLEPGKYGIIAPVLSSCMILKPSELHMVIVPCAAFEGYTRMRVGMGAGYYDRYLPQCVNALRVAAAYEAQHIRGLETEEWDIPMDAIVTEERWY